MADNPKITALVPPLTPTFYALASLIVVPAIAIILMIASLFLLICWPIAPFFLYRQRRQEISKPQTNGQI